jgi:hypothetical protein
MAVATKSKPASKGPSRIVIYTLVGAVAVYAYVLNTTPPAPSTHRTTHVTKKQSSTADNGITPEDLTAHFTRYAAGTKDPFLPAIDLHPGQAPGVPGSGGGEWSLTGVNTIDGVTTATVENPSTADSVFLKAGDRWNGLRVRQVNQDNVVFENALGQDTRLAFPGNNADETNGTTEMSSKGTPAPAAPSAPALPTITILPMQVPAPPPPAAPAANDQSAGIDYGGGGNGNGNGQ